LRHTQSPITQTAQTAVRKRHHLLGWQLCRWPRLFMDHVPGAELRRFSALLMCAVEHTLVHA